MAYTPGFTPTYEDGWEDLPLETTPITAEALNNYDEAIEHIEDYLEQGGGGDMNTTIIAEAYDDTLIYNIGDYVIYDSKLYRCISSTSGTFDTNDWDEISVMDEMTSEFNTISDSLSSRVPQDNIGFVNTSLSTAQKAFAQGEIFYMGYGQKVAIALTNIALNDPLTLHTNYEYTTISEVMASGGDVSLSGLTDTTITSPTNGQVVLYDSTTSKWINATKGNDVLVGTAVPVNTLGKDGDIYIRVSSIDFGKSFTIRTTATGGESAAIAIDTVIEGVVTSTDNVSYRSPYRDYPDFRVDYGNSNWQVTIKTSNVSNYEEGEVISWAYYATNTVTLTILAPQVLSTYIRSRGIWLESNSGGGGSANIWTGTQAEYEAQASQIADGTLVNITDDEEEIAIAESENF